MSIFKELKKFSSGQQKNSLLELKLLVYLNTQCISAGICLDILFYVCVVLKRSRREKKQAISILFGNHIKIMSNTVLWICLYVYSHTHWVLFVCCCCCFCAARASFHFLPNLINRRMYIHYVLNSVETK